MNKLPAVLGGKPAFGKPVPITLPTLPSFERVSKMAEGIFSTGMITNHVFVREFEEKTAEHLGVKHAVAVSSCTSGLMLLMKALELKGKIILPSFTFNATGTALLWNNLEPVFVDIDSETFNLNPARVEEAITKKTAAILAVHVFGNPVDVKSLQEIAERKSVPLIFDSAHAFGASVKGKMVGGFGDAEVFSCSPTKLINSGEGGIISTNNGMLAEKLKVLRNYGVLPDYDCEQAGLNSRMPELNAILGIESLAILNQNLRKRLELVEMYKRGLKKIAGISFQRIEEGSKSCYKDFSIVVDKKEFGIDRNGLNLALEKENIVSKKYFFPPLHRQKIFSRYFEKFDGRLPETNYVSENALSLPLYSHMSRKEVEGIVSCVSAIHDNSEKVLEMLPNA